MSVLEYIEKAWLAYKKNFWSIIIALILQLLIVSIPIIIGVLPWIILLAFSGTTDIASIVLSNLGMLSFSFIMFIFGILLSVVLNGGFVRMLYESLRRRTDFDIMLRTSKEKFWTILGANLIVLLIFFIIIASLFAPVAVLAGFSSLSVSQAPLFLILTLLSVVVLGIIVLVIVSIFFLFVNQAVVIDNLGAVEAVKKSFEFSKKHYMAALFISLIFFFFNRGLTTTLNVFFLLGTILILFFTTPLLLLSLTAFYAENRKKV